VPDRHLMPAALTYKVILSGTLLLAFAPALFMFAVMRCRRLRPCWPVLRGMATWLTCSASWQPSGASC
jgi:hypothetical protein